MPKIGLKTYNIVGEKLRKTKFDVYEISFMDRNVNIHHNFIKAFMPYLKTKEFTLHSQTGRTFTLNDEGYENFSEAEIIAIKSEIAFASFLGIKEYIFHLKPVSLSKKEKKYIKELIKYSKKRKVNLIYESNPYFSAKICLDFLKKFPEIEYNLDLGHLNTAIKNNTLEMNLNEFLSKIKEKTVYIHAHNNYGKKDEHLSLNKGTLDWKSILDKLDMSKIRKIIIEARTNQDIIETKKLLEKYLKKRNTSK